MMQRSVLLLSFLLAGGSAAAQERVAVRPEPGTPLVAMEVLIATGPADETAAQAGIAHLAGRTAVRPIRTALDSLGARVLVGTEKDALSFSLLAPPDTWSASANLLLSALFREEPDLAAAVAERDALRAELTSKEPNPAYTMGRELDAAAFGAQHPWGRPTDGYAKTVEKIAADDVDAFMRANLVPERAWAAVVGPVDSVGVTGVVRGFLSPTPWLAPEAPEPRPARAPVRRNYNYITSWVAASYRFGPDADLPALILLSHLVADQISHGPTRRGVYDAGRELRTFPDGGEIRFHVVVRPDQARSWSTRIQELVRAYSEEPAASLAFQDQLRRVRGLHLLALNSPDARARAVARALLRSGGRDRTPLAVDDVSPERLQNAAQALSAPVVVLLGPAAPRGD